MSRRRDRQKLASANALPGSPVAKIEALGRQMAIAVGNQLGVQTPYAHQVSTPRGPSLRIACKPLITRDDDGRMPLLVIREPKGQDGVFLEVAVDYSWDAGMHYLTHVSLKLYTGPAPNASALRFRAEWDPREAARLHAQPHWNIDKGDDDTAPLNQPGDQAPWIPAAKLAPWLAPEPTNSEPSLDLKKFHFAMAAGWEREAPHHSTPIADESALIRWMAGCTGYIRDQVSGV